MELYNVPLKLPVLIRKSQFKNPIIILLVRPRLHRLTCNVAVMWGDISDEMRWASSVMCWSSRCQVSQAMSLTTLSATHAFFKPNTGDLRYWNRHRAARKKDVSNDNIFGREKVKYTFDSNKVKNKFQVTGFYPRENFLNCQILGQPTNVKSNGLHLCRDVDRIKR